MNKSIFETYQEYKGITIGKRIKFLRDRKQLNQKDVAEILKVSLRQYKRYEKNTSNISIINLIILADLFGVSVDFLLTGKD